jgi:hypothetical protein
MFAQAAHQTYPAWGYGDREGFCKEWIIHPQSTKVFAIMDAFWKAC